MIGAGGRGPDGAFPATVGALDVPLETVFQRALRCDPLAAAVYGAQFGWDRATDQFLAALEVAARPAEVIGRTAVPA